MKVTKGKLRIDNIERDETNPRSTITKKVFAISTLQ